MAQSPLVFDRPMLRRRQARARALGFETFLIDRVASDLADRLGAVLREFPVAADLGTPTAAVRTALAGITSTGHLYRVASSLDGDVVAASLCGARLSSAWRRSMESAFLILTARCARRSRSSGFPVGRRMRASKSRCAPAPRRRGLRMRSGRERRSSRSPHEAKRNAGRLFVELQPRISLRFIRAT